MPRCQNTLAALVLVVVGCNQIFPYAPSGPDRPSASDAGGRDGEPAVRDGRGDDAPAEQGSGVTDGPAADSASDSVSSEGPAVPADGPRPVDGPQPLDGPDVPDGPAIDAAAAVPGTWVTLPAGSFTMGSPPNEPCRYASNETPHQVTLTKAFEISTTEVTQGQFSAVKGYNPSGFASCGGACPVENVSWHEAIAYCNALSDAASLPRCFDCSGSGAGVSCTAFSQYAQAKIYDCPGYRLPTEAEWEYAYRAGTSTAYYSGVNDGALCSSCAALDGKLDPIAWYCANSSNKTHPVGQKQPNAWGLHDMAGNVWEWTLDWLTADLGPSMQVNPWGPPSGTYRVRRGGVYAFSPSFLRAARRVGDLPTVTGSGLGFRCVRTLGP